MADAIKKKADENDGSLEKNGIYLFMDNVDDSTIKPINEWILKENLRQDGERKEFLQLIINSPGGSCPALFSLIDIMFGSRIPIYTTGLGMIASCGFMMFIAGEPGHRVLTPNTSILSHQYSWGDYGKHHELVATRKEQDLTIEKMYALYHKCLKKQIPNKKKREEIIVEKLLPAKDVWLTAKEALKYGVCDKVKDLVS